jgi:predicted MFS family arabinose efflux permease
LGLYYAGPGLGIFVSGAAVPVWLGAGGGWPGAWVMLAGLSAVLALPLLAVRAAGGGTADGGGGPVPLARMAPLMLGYAGFGVGYIGYMTFVFAWVRERWGEGSGQAGFWMVLGLGVMAAPWLWARLMDRLPAARAFGVLTALCGVAAALPLAGAGDGWLWASAALFGASFFAVVATTTQFVRQNMAPEAWPRGVAAVTIAFSLGQTAGPVLSGWAGDAMGGLSAALGFSAAVLLAGATVGAMQPRLR